MKKLSILFIGVLLVGCSREKTLIKEAEKYLQTQMNDPKSYKREWYKIKDTVTILEYEVQLNKDLITGLMKEKPQLIKDAEVYAWNIDYYRRQPNSNDFLREGLVRENKKYNDVMAKLDRIDRAAGDLFNKNKSLLKQEDTTAIKYLDILIRYSAKNLYGGVVRELVTIRCSPDLVNQKRIWQFKVLNSETITGN